MSKVAILPGDFFSSGILGVAAGVFGVGAALGVEGPLAGVGVGVLIFSGGTSLASLALGCPCAVSLGSFCLEAALCTSLILRMGTTGGDSPFFCWLRGGRVIRAENLAISGEPGWSS